MMDIPRGVEVLVKKAAVDAQFHELLLAERAGAAARIGLVLEPAEAAMLQAIPAPQLERVIVETKVPSSMLKAFRGYVAAAMLAALGVGAAGCVVPVAGGARPDNPADRGGREEFPPTIDSPPAAETASPTAATATAAGTAKTAATAVDTYPVRGVRVDDPSKTTTTGVRPDMPKEGK